MTKFEQWWDSVEWSFSMRLIIKPLVKPFAKMAWYVATLEEREACAKACEEEKDIDGVSTAKAFAEIIRARGQE